MLAPIGKTNAVEHYGSFHSSANNVTEPCLLASSYGVNVILGISGQYELSDKPRGWMAKAILANGSGRGDLVAHSCRILEALKRLLTRRLSDGLASWGGSEGRRYSAESPLDTLQVSDLPQVLEQLADYLPEHVAHLEVVPPDGGSVGPGSGLKIRRA